MFVDPWKSSAVALSMTAVAAIQPAKNIDTTLTGLNDWGIMGEGQRLN